MKNKMLEEVFDSIPAITDYKYDDGYKFDVEFDGFIFPIILEGHKDVRIELSKRAKELKDSYYFTETIIPTLLSYYEGEEGFNGEDVCETVKLYEKDCICASEAVMEVLNRLLQKEKEFVSECGFPVEPNS